MTLSQALGLFATSLFFVGSYHDGTLSYSYSFSFNGVGPTLGMIGAVLAIMLALAWFMLRFAPVIPAGAMGEPLKLMESWRLSATVQFRLLTAAVLLTVVFLLLNLLLSLAMALLIGIAGVPWTFYAALVLYLPLLSYGHALWAGLLGATYGLLAAGQSTRKLAATFD